MVMVSDGYSREAQVGFPFGSVNTDVPGHVVPPACKVTDNGKLYPHTVTWRAMSGGTSTR